MKKEKYEIVAENGNKQLARFFPQEEDDFLVEGASEEDVKENFPDYKPEKMEFYMYKHLIIENGVSHVLDIFRKDITKELLGEDVFE